MGAFLGTATITGEIVCWISIYFQSEILACLEDCIWTTIYAYQLVYGQTTASLVICGAMTSYMVFVHIPRMSGRFEPPYLRIWTTPVIKNPDPDTVAWAVPSLLAIVLTYGVYLWELTEAQHKPTWDGILAQLKN